MKILNGEFLLGDCFEHMATIPSGSVDMVCTDVPYNAVNRASGGLRAFDKGVADSAVFGLHDFCVEIGRLCKGSLYVFCGWEQISSLCLEFKAQGFSVRLGVWHKTNPSPMNGSRVWLSGLEFCVVGRRAKATFNEHCKAPLWTFPSQRSTIHPTQKPVALFEYLIRVSSNPGDTVLDSFAGSGTTAVAAENAGRRWICIERDPDYYAKAVDRVLALDPLFQ